MKNLTRILQTAILIALTVVFSCRKESDNTCNVSNPAEDLSWLRNAITDLKAQPDGAIYSYISMGKYQGETVFLIGYCNPAANYIIPVLNCSGDRIGILGEISQDSVTDTEVIWKSENSLCFNR